MRCLRLAIRKIPECFALAAFLCAVAAVPVIAENSAQYQACIEKANTQAEMNACASDEASRADRDLDTVYRKLLALAANRERARAKIQASERAWIAYRDAYLDAMYPAEDKQAAYGSIYPLKADLLRAQLTERQVSALNDLLRQYSGEQH